VAFEPLRALSVLALPPLGALLCALGCAPSPRFPLKDPLWVDTDLKPVVVECDERPSDEDPKHKACTPDVYVSPLAWDAADNSVFRPFAKIFAVDPPRPAPNVNAFDEVPDSAWFTNRLGKQKPSRDELLRGACRPEDVLVGETAPPGSWFIDQGKPNGASPGFRIKVGGKYKYLLKTDSLEQPERPTAASAIGAAIYHAVGFNTSCEQIVYFDPAVLQLKPGLVATDNSGVPRAFDQKRLEWVLKQAKHRDKLVRMQASAWLPGFLLGPFSYEGKRSDDPNDVIAHEDRRDLRGARVLAAWLNHFDAREQNTMDSWIATNPDAPDSSPGHVRHFYLDTSDCFGSEWDWDEISRRLGNSYLFDWEEIGYDFITLGSSVRPWERVRKREGFELFGYFHYEWFEPDQWKNEYPNPAFSRATEHDNAWMTRVLSRLDRDDIEALVTLGRFSEPAHSAYLTEVLEQRLRRIVARYFALLSPLSDVRIDGDRLCALDLARRRGLRPADAFHYRALVSSAQGVRELQPEVRAGGELCLPLSHDAADGGAAADAPSRYRVIGIDNGQSRYALAVHLYDQGPRGGFRVVAVQRPEAALAEAVNDGRELAER
jgi:hypothetical protein